MNNLEPKGVFPEPGIDVSKNAEDVDGVVDSTELAEAGAQTVTVRFTNTGDETLGSLVFEDETTAGAAVTWSQVTLPDGTLVPVGAPGGPAEVTAALAGLELAPGETVEVLGTVEVAAGERHADRVSVTGVGAVSGAQVSDDDATEYLAPEGTQEPEEPGEPQDPGDTEEPGEPQDPQEPGDPESPEPGEEETSQEDPLPGEDQSPEEEPTPQGPRTPGDPDELAMTGAASPLVAAFAALTLVLAGAGTLLARDRRRPHREQ